MYKLIANIGEIVIFTFNSLKSIFSRPFRFRRIIEEMYFIGNESIFIITLTATFTGAVFAYTSWMAFSVVGIDELVGPSVALSLSIEIAPVLTALIIIGRAGAAMAAELGTMRVSEQIDALEVMAISPMQYLVAPKIIACVLAMPMLVIIFNLVGNLGGFFVGTTVCGIDAGVYVYKLKQYLLPLDFFHGVMKSVFFGLLCGSIGCFKGYYTKNGAVGVGRATNDAVVYASVIVIVSDFFLSRILPMANRTGF